MKFRLVEKFIREPVGKSFGRDTCVISAIANAYGLTWDDSFKLFDDYFDLRNIEGVGITRKYYGLILSKLGYIDYKSVYDNSLTVGSFSKQYNSGTYIVVCTGEHKGKSGGHMTCIKDGDIIDTFNPSTFIVKNYYLIRE